MRRGGRSRGRTGSDGKPERRMVAVKKFNRVQDSVREVGFSDGPVPPSGRTCPSVVRMRCCWRPVRLTFHVLRRPPSRRSRCTSTWAYTRTS